MREVATAIQYADCVLLKPVASYGFSDLYPSSYRQRAPPPALHNMLLLLLTNSIRHFT